MKVWQPGKLLPLSETAYYIMLSLLEPRHGYGIMQYVQSLTSGRLTLGAGTLYGSLSRMEKEGLIMALAEEERRKVYQLTETGQALLKLELERLKELCTNGQKCLGELL
ncbi:MAG: PadR family transcriptional regulator [Methylocystaceae bacterium]